MDYESIKRLGLDHMGIDAKNTFETFNPSTNNHTIFIHLLKQYSDCLSDLETLLE